MPPRVRTASPLGDPEVARLLDAAFHRPGRESRVVQEIARGDSRFDPELCLVALDEGRAAGCVALVPRAVRLRGARVELVACGPLGVEPGSRGRGLGRALLAAAVERSAARGARGVVALGVPRLFRGAGFVSAFGLHGLRVPAEVLPRDADTSAWRGLTGEDLPGLVRLHARSHAAVSGAEERLPEVIEWESLGERSHSLVCGGPDGPRAYLRFRVRDELEVTECGAEDPDGVAQVLAMMARLAREHGRLDVAARLPEPHPVARALFHRGALVEKSHLGGAGLLRVLDWPGLLGDLAPAWAPALAGLERAAVSLGVEGGVWRLELVDGEPRVSEGRVAGAHLELPAELAPALVTGERGLEEVWFEPSVREASELGEEVLARLGVFLGPRAAMWGYGAVFELAED